MGVGTQTAEATLFLQFEDDSEMEGVLEVQGSCLAHLTDYIERLETLNETQKHTVVGIPAFKRKNGRNAGHCFIQKAEQLM